MHAHSRYSLFPELANLRERLVDGGHGSIPGDQLPSFLRRGCLPEQERNLQHSMGRHFKKRLLRNARIESRPRASIQRMATCYGDRPGKILSIAKKGAPVCSDMNWNGFITRDGSECRAKTAPDVSSNAV